MSEDRLTERVTVLEHTVVSQNSAMTVHMQDLVTVTREIKTKLDDQILTQTNEMTDLKATTKYQQKEIDEIKADGKATATRQGKTWMAIGMTVILSVIGGVVKLAFF